MFNQESHIMMRTLHSKLAYLLALPIALLLLFVVTTGVFANTVHISDQANVLNTSQVQSAASNLNYPVNIYTTNTFNGTETAFDQRADAKITSKNLIVVAIDTVHRYLRIAGGSNVPLRTYQYDDAISAFKTNFNTGAGYTSATIAALQSLENSLASSNGKTPTNTNASLGWLPYVPFCCIGLFVLAGLVLFGIVRSRRRRFMQGSVAPMQPVNPPYNQPPYPPYGPYNQGPYYGPGYPGGYNQGGIGPWGAGGLGAAAGGLVGYELGKEAGERDAHDDQGFGNYGNDGNNGNFDNGGNDFGAGASGDFGNGGNDFGGGGGGDFGGGASGDFGGGGGGGDTGGSGSF